MSEPVIAAVEAAAGPLVAEAEKALAPEAAIALQDLHQFVTGEMDALRTQLPTLVGLGVEHLHNLGAELLGRYHAVIARVEAHLGGLVPPPIAAPVAPTVTMLPSATAGSGAVSSPLILQTVTPPTEAPAAPAAPADPTMPPTSVSSAPPVSDSSTVSTPPVSESATSPIPSVANPSAATA